MASSPPTSARRDDRRHEIERDLLAAVQRLAEQGASFGAISVERLAGEAGISRSTFYTYFDDKTDVLTALAGDVMSDLIMAADAWWDLAPTMTRGELEGTLRQIVEAYVPHRALMQAVVETATSDVRVREQYAALIDGARVRYAEHIRACQANGTVDAELDAWTMSGWVCWMVERALGRLFAPAGTAERERLLHGLTDILWNTLYRREP